MAADVARRDPRHGIVTGKLSSITGTLDWPMIVATTAAGDDVAGCLVGFHTQSSIDPECWLVCISKVNHTYPVVRRARTLVAHFLRADQLELARIFGTETGDVVDKFAQCPWHRGPDGVPVLDGCDWIAGPIVGRFDLGDHEGQLVSVSEVGQGHPGGAQLGYQQVARMPPGHPVR